MEDSSRLLASPSCSPLGLPLSSDLQFPLLPSCPPAYSFCATLHTNTGFVSRI